MNKYKGVQADNVRVGETALLRELPRPGCLRHGGGLNLRFQLRMVCTIVSGPNSVACGGYPMRAIEADSLVTHWTDRCKRLMCALGITGMQVAPGITDMAQFADTHVGHRFNCGCRAACGEIQAAVCRDMTFLRMVVLASKTSLPTPDQALQGLFQTGACACPSGVHAHLIGGLPHLKQDDVAQHLAHLDVSEPH